MKDLATHILTCPHCGATKLIAYSKASWTIDNSVLWSDGRIESEEWCEPGRTQQCHVCNKFFTLPQTERHDSQASCEDTGQLSYLELKQAIVELHGDDKLEEAPRLEAWWAYNRIYKDVDESDIPVEDREFNRSNMQWLLNYYNRTDPGFQYVTFELLRLLGYEKEYRQKLADMTYEKFAEWYCERFKKRGIDYASNVELLKIRYNSRVEEFTAALNKPLKPYAKQ